MTELKNTAASVKQRLLNLARREAKPFSEVLQHFAMERFLYRLSVSAHSSKFVLKGALLLRVWQINELRPTMDIDMLGVKPLVENELIENIREVLENGKCDDGIIFHSDSIAVEPITEDARYKGFRVRFKGNLDTAKVHLQLDIGFGDKIYPESMMRSFPALLDFPEPQISCYTRESVIAEKFEAIVSLGDLNSRMKDFYDIRAMAENFSFDAASLLKALEITFEQRNTKLEFPDSLLSNDYISGKQLIWNAFRKRMKKIPVPDKFLTVVNDIKSFLKPLIEKEVDGKTWSNAGGWREL